MKHVLGGWNLSGILRYESGRPMTITMTNDLGGLLFNTQKRPNQVGEGMADFGDFDPFDDRYYNPAGWADPGPLQFGNAPERDGEVRGFRNYSEDINIFKVFPFSDQKKLRFEAQIGNLFNRTIYCNPGIELERRELRAGVHAVQHRAVRSARVPVRLLVSEGLRPSDARLARPSRRRLAGALRSRGRRTPRFFAADLCSASAAERLSTG